jgi:hypothetical protein
MQSPMLARDARCICQLRGPALWRVLVTMVHGYPAGVRAHALLRPG